MWWTRPGERGTNLAMLRMLTRPPVCFDIIRNIIVNRRGDSEVKLLSTDYKKCCITVMLCITPDGSKLRSSIFCEVKPYLNQCVTMNDWKLHGRLEDWTHLVWTRRSKAVRSRRSMLVLDSFKDHLTPKVRQKINNMNSDLVIIQGGMRKQL